MKDCKTIFSRNLGYFTEVEQEVLRKSTVCVAGVGGVGGLLAERLIRIGIGHLRIIDPESFEPSNFNRQLCSSFETLGQNKAEVICCHIKSINPEADIHYGKHGIRTAKDASVFVEGADVIVDAMDFGLFRESIYLQREARRRGIYYLFTSAIGFGALTVIFAPGGMTLEEYNGFPADIDLSLEQELTIPLDKICPVIPTYSNPTSEEAEKIVQEIICKRRGAPTTSIGVGLASILSANEVMNILLKKRDISVAPQYTYVDLMDRKFLVGSIE